MPWADSGREEREREVVQVDKIEMYAVRRSLASDASSCTRLWLHWWLLELIVYNREIMNQESRLTVPGMGPVGMVIRVPRRLPPATNIPSTCRTSPTLRSRSTLSHLSLPPPPQTQWLRVSASSSMGWKVRAVQSAVLRGDGRVSSASLPAATTPSHDTTHSHFPRTLMTPPLSAIWYVT